MRTPRPLPDELQDLIAFGVADARALGVPRGRLDRGGLSRPYHGVRAGGALDTTWRRAQAYSVRLRSGQFFSHTTAAELHRLPLPVRVRNDPLLHVSVFGPQQPPRAQGVVGHRLQRRAGLITVVDHLPAVTAIEAWCQLGASLTVEPLVAAGDHLVRAGVRQPDQVLDELRAAITAVRRIGAVRLAEALALLRPGVRSPMESILRAAIVRAGLPEPEVNGRVHDASGRFVGEGDLVYREARMVLEYEGDDHRTDPDVFRRDIRRRERFEDAGWSVLRVTVDDLFAHRAELLARIRRRLAAR